MKTDTEMGDATNGYIGTPGTVPVSHAGNDSGVRKMTTVRVVLRLLALGLCVTALATMVTDEQTHVFTLPFKPPVSIAKTAKYSSILALVVYVYANGIVAGYCLLQALWTIIAKGSSGRCMLWTTFLLDQLVVYGLLGVAGAATETAYLAKNGEPDVQWAKQCQNFSRFCNQVGASVIACFFAIFTLIIIAILSAKQLFGGERAQHTTRKDGYYTNT